MNKSEMADKLAGKCDMSKAKAMEVVNTIFDTATGGGIIAVELDAGRKVGVTGFGTFSTKHRGERAGRNPATGQAITLSAKTYPVFKAGKGLKDRVAK
jgi:DNA-binding protein HU-beta